MEKNLKRDVWEWLNKYGTAMSDVKINYKDLSKGSDSEVVIAHGKKGRAFAFDRSGFESYKDGGLKGFEACAIAEGIAYVLPPKYRGGKDYVNHKTYRIDKVDEGFKVYDKINKKYRTKMLTEDDYVEATEQAAKDAIDIWIESQQNTYLRLEKQEEENAFGFTHPVYKVLFDDIRLGYIFPLKFFTGKAKDFRIKPDDAWGFTENKPTGRSFWEVEKSFRTKEAAAKYAYEFGVDKFGEPEGEIEGEKGVFFVPDSQSEPRELRDGDAPAIRMLTDEDAERILETKRNAIKNYKFQCELFVTDTKGTGNRGSFPDSDEAVRAVVVMGLLTDSDVDSYMIRIYDGSATGIVMGKDAIAERVSELGLERKEKEAEEEEVVAPAPVVKAPIDFNRVKEVANAMRQQVMAMDKWQLERAGANDDRIGQTEKDGQQMIYWSFKASGATYKKGLRVVVYYNSGMDEYVVEGITTHGGTIKSVGTIRGVQARELGQAIFAITDGAKMDAVELTDRSLKADANDLKKATKLLLAMRKNFAESIRYRDTDLNGNPLEEWMMYFVNTTYNAVVVAYTNGSIFKALWDGSVMPKDIVEILEAVGYEVPEEYKVAAKVQQEMIDKRAKEMLVYLEAILSLIPSTVVASVDYRDQTPIELVSMINQKTDLLGNKKENWMYSREQMFEKAPVEVTLAGEKFKFMKGRLRDGKSFYESSRSMLYAKEIPYLLIKQSKDELLYNKAISEGKMTAFDAIYIMWSAGVEVSDWVLAQAGVNADTPTIIGKVLDLKGDEKAGWMLSADDKRIKIQAIGEKYKDLPEDTEEYNRKVREQDLELADYGGDVVGKAVASGAVVRAIASGRLTAQDAVQIILDSMRTLPYRNTVPSMIFKLAYEEMIRNVKASSVIEAEQKDRAEDGYFISLLTDRLNQPKELWMLTFEQFEEKLDEYDDEIKIDYLFSPAFRTPEQVKDGIASVGMQFPKQIKGAVNIRKWCYLNMIGHSLGKDLKFVVEVFGAPIRKFDDFENKYVAAIKEGRMTVVDVKDILMEAGMICPDTILELVDEQRVSKGSIIGKPIDLLGDTKDDLMLMQDEYYVKEKARVYADAKSYDFTKEVKQKLGGAPKFHYRIIGTNGWSAYFPSRILAEQSAFVLKGHVLESLSNDKNNIKINQKEAVREANGDNYYQNMVRQGRMSAADAKAILDDWAIEVPEEIQREVAPEKDSTAESITPDGSHKALYKLSQIFIKEWSGMYNLRSELNESEYVIVIKRKDDPAMQQRKNVLSFNLKTGHVFFGNQDIGKMSSAKVAIRVVDDVFGNYSPQFQKSLREYYRAVWNRFRNEPVPVDEKPTGLQSAYKKRGQDLDDMFGDYFVRNDGRVKDTDISDFGNKLNEDERKLFYNAWRVYVVRNSIVLSDDGYYVNYAIAEKGDGYTTTNLAGAPAESYIRKVIPLRQNQGFVIKDDVDDELQIAYWGYHQSVGDVVDYVKKFCKTKYRVYWFNLVTDVLVYTDVDRNLDYADIENLVVTKNTSQQTKDDLMLDDDKYDLRVKLDSDYVTMFRDFFVKIGGKAEAAKIFAFITGLKPDVKSAYIEAFSEYAEMANLEKRGGYYINPMLYTEEDSEQESVAVEGVAEKPSQSQLDIIQKTAKTAKKGFVVKMDSDDSDSSASWEYAESPLMVMRTIEAHDAKSAMVFYFDKKENIMVNEVILMEWDEDMIADKLEGMMQVKEEDEDIVVEKEMKSSSTDVLTTKQYQRIVDEVKAEEKTGKIDTGWLKKYRSFVDVIQDNKSPYHIMTKSQKQQVENYFTSMDAAEDEFERGGGIYNKPTQRERAMPLASMNIVGTQHERANGNETMTYRYNHGNFTEDMAKKMIAEFGLSDKDLRLEKVRDGIYRIIHDGQQVGVVSGNDFELKIRYVNTAKLREGLTFAKVFPELLEKWETKFSDKFEEGGEVEKVQTVAERFDLPEAKSVEEVKENVLKILSQYSGRDMGNVMVREYLFQTIPLGKEYVAWRGINNLEELSRDNRKLHAVARAGKGKERQESLAESEKEKAEFHLNNILRMAKEQGAAMDARIAAMD